MQAKRISILSKEKRGELEREGGAQTQTGGNGEIILNCKHITGTHSRYTQPVQTHSIYNCCLDY